MDDKDRLLRELDPDFDGSEEDEKVGEDTPAAVAIEVRIKFGRTLLNNSDTSKRKKRKDKRQVPDDPFVLRSLEAVRARREQEIIDGTHFSVRNLAESSEVPKEATHQITTGALQGEYVIKVGDGEKGTWLVSFAGGRKKGNKAFILPKDLKEL